MSTPFITASDRLDQEFINLKGLSNLKVHLSYNGTDNFMNEDLYHGFQEAYLHQLAFEKMRKACDLLRTSHPQLNFLVFDALRPRSVQVKMRKFVEDTPYKDYVADPRLGSLHNFGMAIDLTLIELPPKKLDTYHFSAAEILEMQLDMGTPFDDFDELAQPKLEETFLKSGRLTKTQHSNRLILRQVMLQSGFTQLPHEWWHYNAFDAEFVRENIQIVE